MKKDRSGTSLYSKHPPPGNEHGDLETRNKKIQHAPVRNEPVQRNVSCKHQLQAARKSGKRGKTQGDCEAFRNYPPDPHNAAPFGIFLFDYRGSILDVNQTGADYLGESKRRLIHEAFPRFLASNAEAVLFRAYLRDVMLRKTWQSCELKLKSKKALPLYIQVHSIVAESDGRRGRVIRATVIDVTERKRAEEAVRWSEDALRTVTNSVKDAIVIMDDEGRISFWNPAAEKMFGYASHEAIGFKVHSLIASRVNYHNFRKGLASFKMDGSGPLIGKSFTTWARKKSGANFPVEISLASIKIKNSWYASGIIRDITERKRAEEEAKNDEKRLSSLVKISQSETKTLRELLDVALEEIVHLSDSKFGYIFYYNKDKEEFVLHAWSKAVMRLCTIPDPPTVYQLAKTGIWGEAVRQRRPLIINDFSAPNPLKKGYPKGHAPLYRFMTVPVFNYGRIVAVVGVANKETDYTEADVRQLSLVMDALWNTVERKRAEDDLKISEERFRTIFDTAIDGLILLDTEQGPIPIIADINNAACMMNEHSREELIGKPMTFLDYADSSQMKFDVIEKMRSGKTATYETKHIRRNGSMFPIEVSARLIHIGGRPYILAINRDITERKRAETALLKAHDELEHLVKKRTVELTMANEQLRNLSLHLQNVRENERTMIAREVHDELGQALTAIKMDLTLLRKRMSRDDKSIVKKTETITGLVETTIQTVKRISTDLRPGILDHLGLTAAIEWQAQEFEKRTGIACTAVFEPEEVILDKDRTTTVFRIFQETLTNVARHAKATKVAVLLKAQDDILELHVKDNGKGITEKQISDPKSLGLLGIAERVNYWGGSLTIHGTRKKGTVIVARIRLDGRR